MTAREPIILPVISIEPERDGQGCLVITPRAAAL
jgi:hypothetical protein